MGLVNYLKEKGVTPADIPVVIGAWEVSKISVLFVTLAGVVRYQPLRRLFKRPRAIQFRENFKKRNPRFYNWAETTVMNSAKSLAANRYFKPIPRFFGVRSKNLALALPETLFLYKAAWPLYAPGLLVLIVSCYATEPPVEEEKQEVEMREHEMGGGGSGLIGRVGGIVEEYSEASDVLSTLDGSDETYRSMRERLSGFTSF